MRSRTNVLSPDQVDAGEYLRFQEELGEKRDEFMIKYLRRQWPRRIVIVLGIIQLATSLCILGVDLPVILMFAPRWQVFVGAWAFIGTFITCVSTLHSARETDWPKIKWAAGLNILGGVTAGLMMAFNILILVNPNICLLPSGCNYLLYTYKQVISFLAGEIVLAIAFLISVFIFLVIYIKYGVGGIAIFEDIQNGMISDYDPILPQTDAKTAAPMTGTGVAAAARTVHPTLAPRPPVPRPPMMMMPPPGARPPTMMPPGVRPPGAMMGPRGPMAPYNGSMMPPRQSSMPDGRFPGQGMTGPTMPYPPRMPISASGPRH